MKKRSLFCILLLCTLVSCNKKINSVEYRLCGKNYKYWLLIDNFSDNKRDTTPKVPQMLFFYFNSNGKFLRYWKQNIYMETKVDSFPYYDIVMPNTWQLDGDSILTILGGSKYTIKYISDDIMILQHNSSKTYDLYFNVGDSLLLNNKWGNIPNFINNDSCSYYL